MLSMLLLCAGLISQGHAETPTATGAAHLPVQQITGDPSNTDLSAKKNLNPAPTRKAQQAGPPPFVERHQRELLALLALLILWLVTRLFVQPEPQRQRPSKRHSPLSADEFARIVYSILTGENIAEYRGLFITGPEAARVMGEGAADAYLHARTGNIFELAFNVIFDRFPPGARFETGHLDTNDVVELWVVDQDHRRHRIPIGEIVFVGAVMRLVTPAVGSDYAPKIEHTGTHKEV